MAHQRDTVKTVLAMVGLPARGKTYIARKVARYLNWLGHPTRVFNVGSYRREFVGAEQSADFFDPDNFEGHRALTELAMRALDDMLAWLDRGGECAIYDATNSTKLRRQIVQDRCRQAGVQLVFIESICDDESVIEANVRETKLTSPDYANTEPEAAADDFRARIANYAKVYEPIDDPDQSYIKIIDVGRQVVLNRIHGYMPAHLAPLLINLNVTRRPIYLTRHGESLYNMRGIIGGDSELSLKGEGYAKHLAAFIRTHAPREAEAVVWTSSLRRSICTAKQLTAKPVAWRALDEIDAGICDGMTYDQIKRDMPDVYAARKADKFRYRYPRGESYEDVITRLEPVIIQLERQRHPVLVISHQAVLRALYAYLVDKPASECPKLPIPLHTVIQLTPTAYGCEEQRIHLGPTMDDPPVSLVP